MKKIYFRFALFTLLVISIFASCSDLLNSEETEQNSGKSFTILLNSQSQARTITPVFLTEDKLLQIENWNVKITDSNGAVSENSISASKGALVVETDFTGKCSIEVTGSYTDSNGTVKVEGSAADVEVLNGSAINIVVDTVKAGSGTFSYQLYLDDSWEIGSDESPLDLAEIFESHDIKYENFFLKDKYRPTGTTYVEKENSLPLYDTDETNFHAELTPVSGGDAITLTCSEYYSIYNECTEKYPDGNGSELNVLKYLLLSSESSISAGLYKLSVWARNESLEDKATTVSIPVSDEYVEILDGYVTSGAGLSVCYNSSITVDAYYVTNGNAGKGYNGRSPKSRININELVSKLESSASDEAYIYLTEADLADYKDWSIWQTWDKNITFYGFLDGENIGADNSMQAITFSNGTTSISSGDLGLFGSVQTIVFGKGLTTIGSAAFDEKSSLTAVVIPESTGAWYTAEGTPLTYSDINDFETLNGYVSKGSIEKVTQTDFGAPYAVWDGLVLGTTYNKFRVSTKICKYIDTVSPVTLKDVKDFVFDNDKNLYASINDSSDNPYSVVKYSYSSGFATSETIISADTIGNTVSAVSLYYDTAANKLYAYDNSAYLYCYDGSNTIKYKVTLDSEIFAVSGEYVYTYNPETYTETVYKLEIETSDDGSGRTTNSYLVNDVTPTEPINLRVPSVDGTEVFSEYSTNLLISDMAVADGCLYVLVRENANEFYSRGAVLKFAINSAGTLTYSSKLGWYENNTALNLPAYDGTVADFMSKYFTGPTKFVAVKPEKLILADDGAYWESSYNMNNVNRIVTVDLEKFAIEDSEDVDAIFERTARWNSDSANSQFTEISFDEITTE